MTEDTTYQGWTNHATWAVALWIDNDRDAYEAWRYRTKECLRWATDRGVGWTKREQAAVDLAECLKEQHTAEWDAAYEDTDVIKPLWADLMRSVWDDVNWREIAESMLADLP